MTARTPYRSGLRSRLRSIARPLARGARSRVPTLEFSGSRRGAARPGLLRMVLALGFATTTGLALATAQGPAGTRQALPPDSLTGGNPSSGVIAGVGLCPPGSNLQEATFTDCFPDCTGSLQDLSWGVPPIPPEILEFPKFNQGDCNLGRLVGVRIDYTAFIDGRLCIDNLDLSCTAVQGEVGGVFSFQPAPPPGNDPPLTVPVTDVIAGLRTLPLLQLAPRSSPTPDDCPDPNAPEGGADGACPGNGVDNYTLLFSGESTGQHLITDPTLLNEWILGAGNPTVRLQSIARVDLQLNAQGQVAAFWTARGRVRAEVTYIYCSNAAPVCVTDNQPVVTNEDTPVAIRLLDHVTDVDSCLDCSTFQIVTGPTHGTLGSLTGCTGQGGSVPGCNDCGQCQVIYTPTANYCGPDSITFRVRDTCGLETICTVPIQVNPVNDPPVCQGTTVKTNEDTFLLIDFKTLVTDVDNPPNGCGDAWLCGIEIVSPPSCGTLTEVPGQCAVWRFDPAPNSCGQCTFTYRARDEGGAFSQICTVTININPVNDPPVCTGTTVKTNEDTPLLIDFRTLVTDIDNAPNGCGAPWLCDIVIVSPPSCGTLTPTADCAVWRFDPTPNACGQCTFTYRARDEAGALSGICTVTININPVNDPPVCVGTRVTTTEGTPVVIDFRPLVTDIDNAPNGCGSPWTCGIVIVSHPNCGSLSEIDCGRWLFTPNAGFCGQCSFTYQAQDDGGALSQVCTVLVNVTPTNDPPVCAGATLQTNEDTFLLIDFKTLVTDPDNPPNDGCGDPWLCGIEIVSPPSCGALTEVPGQCAVWRFDPTPGSCGQCTFTYRARDEGGALSGICTVTIVINPVNDPPVCTSFSVTTAEDTAVVIDFRPRVTDPDNPPNGCGSPWTCGIQIVSPPSCGSLTEVGCGQWQFTPNQNFCGQCTFTYRAVDDGGAQSAVCTVTITVTPVNDPPVCTSFGVTTAEDTPVVIDFRPRVTDVDNPPNSCGSPWTCGIQIVSPPSCGTLTEVGCGQWQFTPNQNFCGQCTFTYRAVDGGGAQSAVCTVTITVTPVNDPPVCTGATFNTPQGSSLVINLQPLVDDPDNHPPSGCGAPWQCGIEIVSPPSCGTLTLIGCASYRFDPSPGFCGNCSFTYRARDEGNLFSQICTVNLVVDPVNRPPVCQGRELRMDQNTFIDIDLCELSSDPDEGTGCGSGLDCESFIVTQPDCGGTLVHLGGGVYRFTPPLGFLGTCTFSYRARDFAGELSVFCQIVLEVEERCDPTGLRRPGSMLLYPEFDNREGVVTMFSITNTSRTQEIEVKFWYVNEVNCATFDRKVQLTALDNFTVVTNFHNPDHVRGYAFAVAQCRVNNRPVVFDHLIGQLNVVDGIENFGFAINAVAFPGIGQGGGTSSCGLRFTDVNFNQIHELNGIEYGPAPDEILIPRFFGQTEVYQSELILIGLTGGKQFTTTVDFLIYNDNEEVFSSEYTFYCWKRVPLLDIDFTFGNEFLAEWTNNDPDEVWGDPTIQTGWMQLKGYVANSSTTSLVNPAIYAVLIERTGPNLETADLPWGRCSRETGALLPKSNSGQ